MRLDAPNSTTKLFSLAWILYFVYPIFFKISLLESSPYAVGALALALCGFTIFRTQVLWIVFFGFLQLVLAPSLSSFSKAFYSVTLLQYYDISLRILCAFSAGVGATLQLQTSPTERVQFAPASFANRYQIRRLIMLNLTLVVFSEILGGIPIIGAILWYGTTLIGVIFAYSIVEKKYFLAFLTFTINMLIAIESTFFWNVMMWGCVALGFKLYKNPRLAIFSIITLPVFAITIGITQTYKHSKRSGLDVDISDLPAFVGSIANSNTNNELISTAFGRFDQGLHDSHVYASEKFKKKLWGKTFVESTLSTLLPRFLWQNKPSFGTKRYSEYTGYMGMGGSFISHSMVAEIAMNFPPPVDILFGFLLGFFLVWLNQRISVKYGILLSTIPFFHVLRQEVDSFHWASSLVYGTLFLYVFRSFILKQSVIK